MQEWFKQSEKDKKLIIEQTSIKTGLSTTAVEKDFWVMLALSAIFKTTYAPYLVFKGGTSLSKAWNLTQRFSEDVDLAFDREFLGFKGDLDHKQVTKLRKAACKLVTNDFKLALTEALTEMGVEGFTTSHVEFERSDTDPVALELKYESITDRNDYLKPQILIEVSARSLRHPFQDRPMKSLIAESFQNEPFCDKEIEVPTVLPKRTLIEKMFLLHEEFQKPLGHEIKSHRMTRHLYDLGKIIDSGIAQEAIDDVNLYRTIVKHREMLTKVSWVDYSTHAPQTLNFVPPDRAMKAWKDDYNAMSESMFQGEVLLFEELIQKLRTFNDQVNQLTWSL